MVFYRVTTHKRIYLEPTIPPWTNVYHVDAASVEDALDKAESIVEIEKTVHWSNIQFYKVSAKQPSELSQAGQSRTIEEVGDRDATDEKYLPLFCTVRVIFEDSIKRPDQKYLRTPLMESDVENGQIITDTITLVDTSYAEALVALAYIRSSSNESYTSGFTVRPVQMRQRDWHRRTRPGFKRGWVPVE